MDLANLVEHLAVARLGPTFFGYMVVFANNVTIDTSRTW